MTMDKPQLRRELKARLQAVTPADRSVRSLRGAHLLFDTAEYQSANLIMLFLSLPSEIDTQLVIDHALAHGKRLAIPRTDLPSRRMEAVALQRQDPSLHKTRIGVMEPASGDVLPPATIDLVLTPGLGFGPAGQRLGRGAGFYDRFISDPALKNAITCGFAFEEQVMDQIPMGPSDVHLMMLVTDALVRRFPG